MFFKLANPHSFLGDGNQSNYNRANDAAGWQPTPTTADVTITKIARYVRVHILMNLRFFHIFVIHGCGGGLDFAPMREPLEGHC